eukprot:6206401-Pleurochrysis_carterae.AAC.2
MSPKTRAPSHHRRQHARRMFSLPAAIASDGVRDSGGCLLEVGDARPGRGKTWCLRLQSVFGAAAL